MSVAPLNDFDPGNNVGVAADCEGGVCKLSGAVVICTAPHFDVSTIGFVG